jgi:hypothetical protein
MKMGKVSNELNRLIKDVEKIKIFCAYVAEEHDHIPHLLRVWNENAGDFQYLPNNTKHEDMNVLKGTIMKSLLELEDRITNLEQLVN